VGDRRTVAAVTFGDLPRREKWLPLGARRHSWLAAAAYAPFLLFLATLAIFGFASGVDAYGRWLDAQ
jgi:hypothetical protein